MAEQKKNQLQKRNEADPQFLWKLEDIFASDDLWEKELKELKVKAEEISRFEGHLADNADTFFEMMVLQDEVMLRLGKLYAYAHMKYDQDTTNSTYKGLNDKAEAVYAQIGSKFAFIVPEILQIPEEQLKQYLKDKPELEMYEYALEEVNRQRPHILSSSEEAILAAASEVLGSPSAIFGSLNNSDLKFPEIKDEEGHEVEVTHGRYSEFLESEDPRVRKDAFHAVYETYGKFVNTFASTLSASTKRNVFSSKVRKYESARQAALSANDIPETVYDQLVDTINENLPLLHRYVALRKRILNVDELHMYDLYTPLVKDAKIKVKYEEAKDMVLKGLSVLGEEYGGILKEGFNDGWIDVYENVGKRSGAYSSGSYATNPYILLNWQDNVNNLFTLAHELGHSVHSYYTRKNQPFVYGDYSIFVAEVASTCNEALLNDYLLKTTEDKSKRLYLLNYYLEGFRATVFRQTMFAEFEHAIHKKVENDEPLTPDTLNEMYYELNKKYFGEKDIVVDEEIRLEWARIPHFYYNYYVYQYATGFSAATALSKGILEEGQPAIDRYLEFLQSGSSASPIEVLKKAGVDMTSAEPIREAMKVFEERLTEMEQLLDEMK